MKLTDPYKCDECGALKTPSNGWFILDERPMQNHYHPNEMIATVAIYKWVPYMADWEHVIHACSTPCAIKISNKLIAKLDDRVKEPTNNEPGTGDTP